MGYQMFLDYMLFMQEWVLRPVCDRLDLSEPLPCVYCPCLSREIVYIYLYTDWCVKRTFDPERLVKRICLRILSGKSLRYALEDNSPFYGILTTVVRLTLFILLYRGRCESSKAEFRSCSVLVEELCFVFSGGAKALFSWCCYDTLIMKFWFSSLADARGRSRRRHFCLGRELHTWKPGCQRYD